MVNAITGSTGAGVKPGATSHFSWRDNNLSVYKAFEHQHIPEIKQSLKKLQSSFDADIDFIPYRGNFPRGIFATIVIKTKVALDEIKRIYDEYYEEDSFVHIVDKNIDLKQVVNTNKCLLHLEKHDYRVTSLCAPPTIFRFLIHEDLTKYDLSCEAGRDAHYGFGKYAVYPNHNFALHKIPFTEGAFKLDGKTKMASAVMPYYTISYGQGSDTVANSYDADIITRQLREEAHYDGVICTDWMVTADEKHPGIHSGKP